MLIHVSSFLVLDEIFLAREDPWEKKHNWEKEWIPNVQIWKSSVLLCLLVHMFFFLSFLGLLLACVCFHSITFQNKKRYQKHVHVSQIAQNGYFHVYMLYVFLFPNVSQRINTLRRLWISRQGLPAAPGLLLYPKPHAKLMTVVFLSAPLPRPFKHNECVKTVLWLYMKPLWTVWGVRRNQTSLRRGGESSSVFAEWNLSTRLFDSPRSNSACQQWRI